MKLSLRILPACVILSGLLTSSVWATPIRVNQVPNGSRIGCGICHVSAGGGGARNSFGTVVERSFLSGGNVVWGPLLASLDADGDGVTNGVELQDQYGQWTSGQPAPGNPNLVSNPGTSANFLRQLTVNFSGMGPHVGQALKLRVVDKANRMEVGRTSVPSIAGPDFSVNLNCLLDGGSYWVDFFADFNGNGLYDSPPTDHAWRLNADNVSGNTVLNFAHQTTFTDVAFPYALTVNLSSMNPHVGQLIEMRVINETDQSEVGRKRIETIPGASFSVVIPGLTRGSNYRLDMYADLNNNRIYNAPPADHAWRLPFSNPNGDVTVDFVHNTTFTDVQWEYLMQMNLLGFGPHLGNLFELRVVDTGNNQEIGRTRIESIQLANSSVIVPGIRRNGSYHADFYADLSGNGRYDAPPVDHAWRHPFTTPTGNVVINYSHNTNFTDIQWPELAAGDEHAAQGIPRAYTLDQNYPNPFNPATMIGFDLAQSGVVELEVFNLVGQKVATLAHGPMAAGHYELTFQAGDLPSGLYLYRLSVNGLTAHRKMILMK